MKTIKFKGKDSSDFYVLEYLEKNKFTSWHLNNLRNYVADENTDYKFIAVVDKKYAEKFINFCEIAAGINKKSKSQARLPFTKDQIRKFWVTFLYKELTEEN